MTGVQTCALPISSGQLRPSSFPECSGPTPGGHLGCGQSAERLRLRRGLFSGGRVASLRLEAGGASAAEMTQAEKGDTENGKEKGGEKEKEQRGVKRPIVPALVPESLQEVRRRGRASDSASGRGGGPRSWARGGG